MNTKLPNANCDEHDVDQLTVSFNERLEQEERQIVRDFLESLEDQYLELERQREANEKGAADRKL